MKQALSLMKQAQSFINREHARRVALGLAAPGVLAALAPVAEASSAQKLLRFVEAHRSAKSAGDGAMITENEARAQHESLPHPIAEKALGFYALSPLDAKIEQCKEAQVLGMRSERGVFNKLSRNLSAPLVQELERVFELAVQDRLALIDEMYAEHDALEQTCGAKEAQRLAREAGAARNGALLALCASTCRTLQDVAIKQEYLATIADEFAKEHLGTLFGSQASNQRP